jgi:hypothetical protein
MQVVFTLAQFRINVCFGLEENIIIDKTILSINIK